MTEMDMQQSLRSSLATRQKEQPQNRAIDRLSSSLTFWSLFALVVEGSDLGISEAQFEPAARCIHDTKKRQLVTKSGLPRSRCCVCHLHHKWAMKSPAAVRHFFKTALQQVSLQG